MAQWFSFSQSQANLYKSDQTFVDTVSTIQPCECVRVLAVGKLQIPADTNKGACSSDQRALHICSPHGAVFPNLIRRACLYVDCQSQASLWRSHLPAEVQERDRWAEIPNRLVVKPGELPCRYLECGNVLDVSVSWLEWRVRACSWEPCLCALALCLTLPCTRYVQNVQWCDKYCFGHCGCESGIKLRDSRRPLY